MKAFRRSFAPLLTSEAGGIDWSASCLGSFTLREKSRYAVDKELSGPQS